MALQRAILRSERRRVTLLLAVLALLLALVLVVYLTPGLMRAQIRAGLESSIGALLGILGGYLLYEAASLRWLGRLIENGLQPPAWWPFVNAAIEVTLPTLAIVPISSTVGSLAAMAGAVPFLYMLLILSVVLSLDFRLCVFAGALSGVEFFALNRLLLPTGSFGDASSPVVSMLTSPHQYTLKSILFLTAGLVGGFVANQFRTQLTRVIQTLDERDRAISIFGQHVSPQVAELLLKQQVDASGEERDVCVMFLDIRDFSKFASAHSAPEVMSYLNTLFGFMIPLVNRHHGMVNKFLGDGFMAVFGAPLDDAGECVNASRASVEILRGLDELNNRGEVPRTRIGIGLHVGQAATGNVGTAERKEYTIIGDVVNLASRIEQATKQLHSQLLVSEQVAVKLAAADEFTPEDMGLVELKGQPHPVHLFKLA